MPVFQARTRVQILRDMVARVVARSSLVSLVRNNVIYHLLVSAANEDAEQYFQLSLLRASFSIDNATGSDLDERAAEIQPAVIKRILSTPATTSVQFARTTTAGTQTIGADTVVGAADSQGPLNFKTTASVTISAGNTLSAPVAVVAVAGGTRYNVVSGAISRMITRVPGIVSVTNPDDVVNGLDRESNSSFRARIKEHVQGLARSTVLGVLSVVRSTVLANGQRVLFASTVEPVIPNGHGAIYVDDGTGLLDTYDSTYASSPDTIVASAVGGETNIFTTARPIRDDGSFALYRNASLLVRNTAYYLNPATGQIQLVTPLTAADAVTANYRNYNGLVQQAQKLIDGLVTDPQNYPGARAFATLVQVLPASRLLQTVVGTLDVEDGFDELAVIAQAVLAIAGYVNTLNIGQPLIWAKLVQTVMDIDGVANLKLTAPLTDQVVLPYQVARVINSSISLV